MNYISESSTEEILEKLNYFLDNYKNEKGKGDIRAIIPNQTWCYLANRGVIQKEGTLEIRTEQGVLKISRIKKINPHSQMKLPIMFYKHKKFLKFLSNPTMYELNIPMNALGYL